MIKNIVPRTWYPVTDISAVGYGPNRVPRFVSVSPKFLRKKETVYVRQDGGARPMLRIYTEAEYREYWCNKFVEAMEVFGDGEAMEVALVDTFATLRFGADIKEALIQTANELFEYHGRYGVQLVSAVYLETIGDVTAVPSEYGEDFPENEWPAGYDDLIPNVHNYHSAEIIRRIIVARVYGLPVQSECAKAIVARCVKLKDFTGFHKYVAGE